MKIFDGPDIRKLVKDPPFIKSMNDVESRARTSFKSMIQNFLGNRKASNCRQLVDELTQNYGVLGANINIKMHFLYSCLHNSPENFGEISDEQVMK